MNPEDRARAAAGAATRAAVHIGGWRARSADYVLAGYDGVDAIDAALHALYESRSILVAEIRADEDERARRIEARARHLGLTNDDFPSSEPAPWYGPAPLREEPVSALSPQADTGAGPAAGLAAAAGHPSTSIEGDPPPMLRSVLVAALNDRRDNDVYAEVPLETGGSARLAVHGTAYDPTNDVILVRTDTLWNGPDEVEGGDRP